MPRSTDPKQTHDLVRKAYGEVAKKQSPCCCCGSAAKSVPDGDLGLSCGDPVTFSQLEPGDVVLDLGSGAGMDAFLAAHEVGPAGRVIGVDMTPEMVERARENAGKVGVTNVEFRLGEIERLPVADAEVDVIISNCVINLSPDKPAVFAEAFRALKPGGRMVVSDLVLTRPIPDDVRHSVEAYVGCVAGAAMKDEYLYLIGKAGFRDIEVVEERSYGDAEVFGGYEWLREAAKSVVSAKVRAVKPL